MAMIYKEPLFWLAIANGALLVVNLLLLRFNDKLIKSCRSILREVRVWQNVWKKAIEDQDKKERGF